MEELVEEGRVKEIQNGMIKVELIEHDECEHCSAKIVCSPTSDNKRILELENSINSNIGDRVRIVVPGIQLTKLSIKLYLIPLVIVLVIIYVTLNIANDSSYSELISVGVASFSLLIYYITFMRMSKKKENESLHQIILSKLN